MHTAWVFLWRSHKRDRAGRPVVSVAVSALMLVLAGCNLGQPTNPSFDVTVEEARAALEAAAADPVTLPRPVLVVGGWQAKSLTGLAMYRLLDSAIASPVVPVTFEGADTFSACRTRLLEAAASVALVDERGRLGPVDVVGISMGGMVARDAAVAPRPDGDDPRVLRIERFYGIGVPYRGVAAGTVAFWDERAREMQRDGAIHARLRALEKPGRYAIEDYARLGDVWVNTSNASRPGMPLRWLPNLPLSDAHLGFDDPRIVADIVRRLRGEPPFSTDPAAPLP